MHFACQFILHRERRSRSCESTGTHRSCRPADLGPGQYPGPPMRDDGPWDEIEDIEESLDDLQAKVTRLDRLAVGSAPGSGRWADLTVVAADHRIALGQVSAAIEQLEAVRVTGAFTEPSVEALLISAHLRAGNEDEATELEREHRRRSRSYDLGDDYTLIGEAYEEVGSPSAEPEHLLERANFTPINHQRSALFDGDPPDCVPALIPLRGRQAAGSLDPLLAFVGSSTASRSKSVFA